MHKLGVIALSGLAISAICLGAAAAIGAREHVGNIDFSMFDDEPNCAPSNATAGSRSFAWDGGNSVTVEVPVNLHYRPGPSTTLEAKGDPEMLAHLKVHDGKIDMNCRIRHWRHQRINITLPGREFREYHIAGVADLDLQGLNQASMKLEIAGRGTARMKDLAVKNLNVDIAGRGEVETSPSEKADIDIAGSGNVKLYTEPKSLDTSIMGSGNVEHLAGKS